MKNRLTKMQIVKLIFFSSVKIEGKKYKIHWIMEIIKVFMNFIFIMGGIFWISLLLGKLLEILDIDIDIYFGYLHIVSILLILIVNILIVKFSPLVKIEEN